jgi:phage terminase large subunit-like protein
VRLAAQRFISDLKRSQSKHPPFLFSPGQANRACAFVQELPHVEGTWATPHITLHASHVFFIVNLFGFRSLDGNRRFTSALFAVARKNAKSTLAAAILLYCLCFENEEGAQVLSAATTGSQARIVFNVAKRMVDGLSDLRDEFTVEAFAGAIVRYEIGGNFKPINSKASTQDGLNPSHVSLDEIHAHKTRDLLDVLRSAAGGRLAPLFLYTTTEGYENPGPWSELRAFAQNILNGVVKADHFLALYYAVDEGDDDFDERAWGKANPLMDVNPLLVREIRKMAIEAQSMPGALAEFQIKRLNRQAAAATGWVDLRRWRRCAGPVPLDELAGSPCWGALDLASTRDMNAWRLLWLKDGVYYTWGRYWVPSLAVAQRTERRSVPYAGWVASGFLTQTEGDVADYGVIRVAIVADWERFSPIGVAYDPWNATQLALELADAGVPMQKFIQGPRSYHPAMQACEIAYISGHLRHGGDPVLLWNAANIVASKRGENQNMMPDKKRSADKIDGMAALIMAFGLAAATDVDDADANAFFAKPVRA